MRPPKVGTSPKRNDAVMEATTAGYSKYAHVLLSCGVPSQL
eukprot:CAMPEP_0176407664 /NCGR_PEP_ID=MMETSP0127-20121128/1530_1 /TAXON_ID=938130 /ORGANISM="Platyophrya macrostoma, Strain WH" /LENGTH=40 /DNA_ID= /DNA_START= /DNA_END= /DNA_ORIENTATION=